MLSPARFSRQEDGSRAENPLARTPPVLLLSAAADDDLTLPGLTARLKAKSARFVATADDVQLGGRAQKPGDVAGLQTWREIEAQFPSVCLGLVADSSASITAASRILRDGLREGTAPGAIALLGCTARFVTTCLDLAGACDRPVKTAGARRALARAELEDWPTMMILLPEDTPSLGDWAASCRQMRSVGIPVRLEIVGSTRNAEIADVVDELERFFDDHLAPYFPKLL